MTSNRLVMIKDDFSNLKVHELPKGYSFRNFKEGDKDIWVSILVKAQEFSSNEAASKRFRDEFGSSLDLLKERCFFLLNEKKEPIGTIMAWQGDERGFLEGRIHWVAIIPEYQGRGLAKPLVYKALSHLKKSAYLSTQSNNIRAIGLYTYFGFEPLK